MSSQTDRGTSGGCGGLGGEISHSFESRIDKMRRFISSPLTRRKSTSQASPEIGKMDHHKIFGTPIEILAHQQLRREMSTSTTILSTTSSSSSGSTSTNISTSSSNMSSHTSITSGNTSSSSMRTCYQKEKSIPYVITRLCHYIEDSHGLMQEGLFRTSGNARLIEKLKTSFDTNGDAPLETEGDIPSAAALLKLFLRELPVPLIPQSIHSSFLDTVQDALNQTSYDKDAFIARLKVLVENLPDENYFLLKYLSRFLHRVALHEHYNRMTPSSLGIIFGPNIFRVAAEDYKGLREQSLTNQVVTFFITDYEAIFGRDYPEKDEVITVESISTTTPPKATLAANKSKTEKVTCNQKENYMPLHVDIPPIDYTEAASNSSHSTNQLKSFSEEGSKEYLLVVDKAKSVHITRKKRKEMKFILPTNSSVIRSSSEERKVSYLTGDSFQEIRRCNSYQDVVRGGPGERPKSNMSTESGSIQPSDSLPKSKVETMAKSLESSLSFEQSRPSSLELSSVNVSEACGGDDLKKLAATGAHEKSDLDKDASKIEDHSTYSLESRKNNEQFKQVEVNKTPPIDCRKKASSLSTSISSDSSCKENDSTNVPRLDLNTLHKNAESDSALVSDLRYSWSSTNDSLSSESLHDDDDSSATPSDSKGDSGKGIVAGEPPIQNAAMQILKRRNTYEAPLSPSAYRGFLGQRAPHLDPTIPPSPPGEQEHLFHGNKASYNHENAVVKDAKKKIHALKRRLKAFESDFEKESGYRPSHDQKMKSIVAKPLLFELNKYRKILRELKEDARFERTTEFYEGVFFEMQRSLRERRCVVGRPEIIEDMSVDQIFDEKLDLQKSLLKYESVFGRPSRKEDRTVMKPLYDRYRTIRNLVAKIPKNKDSTDLQPILENVAMNFSSPPHSPKNSSTKDTLIVGDDSTAEMKQGQQQQHQEQQSSGETCKDTQDLAKSGRTGDKVQSSSHHHQQSHKLCHNLHELPPSELVKELHLVWREKQELRKLIRSFEEEFYRANGRKVNETEKSQMESVYSNYKASKKKLRLLEALIGKYEKRKMES